MGHAVLKDLTTMVESTDSGGYLRKKVDATRSGLSTRLLGCRNDLVSGYLGARDPKDQGEMFDIFSDLTLEVIYLPPYSIGASPQTAPNARGRIN